MIRRDIQCLEVVVVAFHFRPFHHFIAHAHKDSLQLLKRNGVGMSVSDGSLLCGERHIDNLRLQLCLSCGILHLLYGGIQHLLDLFSGLIHHLTDLRSVLRCHILHGFQHSGQLTLFSKDVDAHIIELVQRIALLDLLNCSCPDLFQFVSHVLFLSCFCYGITS